MTIKIIGIGDAGCLFANQFAKTATNDAIQVIALNTFQSFRMSEFLTDYQFHELSGSIGTGGDPMVGRKIGEANKDLFYDLLAEALRVIIVAGMGGGLGTGAAHVIAYVAREMRIPCIAVVSMPFSFEGETRTRLAKLGVKSIKKFADDVIDIDAGFIESQMQYEPHPQFAGLTKPVTGYFELMHRYMTMQVRLHLYDNG